MNTRTIIIHQSGPNYFGVSCGDRHSDGLTWDECLGQIAALLLTKEGEPHRGFPMMTIQEFRDEARKNERRDALRNLRPFERLLLGPDIEVVKP